MLRRPSHSRLVNQRTNLSSVGRTRTEPETVCYLTQTISELVGDSSGSVQSVRSHTRLPGIVEFRKCHGSHDVIEICILEDKHRSMSAKLKADSLHRSGRSCHQLLAHLGGA